jgi:hypothetical protein
MCSPIARLLVTGVRTPQLLRCPELQEQHIQPAEVKLAQHRLEQELLKLEKDIPQQVIRAVSFVTLATLEHLGGLPACHLRVSLTPVGST